MLLGKVIKPPGDFPEHAGSTVSGKRLVDSRTGSQVQEIGRREDLTGPLGLDSIDYGAIDRADMLSHSS